MCKKKDLISTVVTKALEMPYVGSHWHQVQRVEETVEGVCGVRSW